MARDAPTKLQSIDQATIPGEQQTLRATHSCVVPQFQSRQYCTERHFLRSIRRYAWLIGCYLATCTIPHGMLCLSGRPPVTSTSVTRVYAIRCCVAYLFICQFRFSTYVRFARYERSFCLFTSTTMSDLAENTFLFTSESVNEGHPGMCVDMAQKCAAEVSLLMLLDDG